MDSESRLDGGSSPKARLAILRNETDQDHLEWVSACEKHRDRVDYEVVGLTRDDWLDRLREGAFDFLLARPSGSVGYYKQLYDERLYILSKLLGLRVYPTYEEVLVYENKRMLAYWLKATGIPHPQTWIFYHEEEAFAFAEKCDLPVVAKTAIGAGGSGVVIHRSKSSLNKYLRKAFCGKGIIRTWGPNLRKGDVWRRISRRVSGPIETYRYFRDKRKRSTAYPQKSYVILQEYIPCQYEWRCVKIGESYFGHKKLRTIGELMSGTSAVSWDVPSYRLLDFVRNICDKSEFLSQAIDIFETEDGRFLVNEMQCFFGSKNPHQMLRNGVPGRFVYESASWRFEEGIFNTNNSHDLRIEHVLHLVDSRQRGVEGTLCKQW